MAKNCINETILAIQLENSYPMKFSCTLNGLFFLLDFLNFLSTEVVKFKILSPRSEFTKSKLPWRVVLNFASLSGESKKVTLYGHVL